MQKISVNKADVIARLKSKLPVARAWDREQAKKHTADCRRVAKERREYLRALVASADRDLAQLDLFRMRNEMPDGASCPASQAHLIEREIERVSMDRRDVFQVDSTDQTVLLMEWDPTAQRTVCGD